MTYKIKKVTENAMTTQGVIGDCTKDTVIAPSTRANFKTDLVTGHATHIQGIVSKDAFKDFLKSRQELYQSQSQRFLPEESVSVTMTRSLRK